MNEKKLIDEVNERLQKACSKFIDEYITKYYKDLVEENERLREDLYDARHMMWTRGEENKKLKEHNGELIENHKKDIAILCEENEKLKDEVEQLKNQRIFNSTEYDLITLTSTTPQWELRRK